MIIYDKIGWYMIWCIFLIGSVLFAHQPIFYLVIFGATASMEFKKGSGVTQVTWFAVGCSFRGTMHQENNTASISSIGAWPGSIGFWVICWGILFTMFNGHPGLPSDTICWLRVQDISSMPPSDGFSWTPWAWKPQCVFMCMDRWERLGSRHLTPRSIELLRRERAGGWRAAVF